MNKTIGRLLIVYSLLLAGLSSLAHYLAPGVARPTLIAGVVGAALCLIWGLRAVAGKGGKALPILTLVPVSFVLLPQIVTAWSGGAPEMQGRPIVAVLIILLLGLSVLMIVRIAWSGVVFDTPLADPGRQGEAKPQATAKTPPQRNARTCL